MKSHQKRNVSNSRAKSCEPYDLPAMESEATSNMNKDDEGCNDEMNLMDKFQPSTPQKYPKDPVVKCAPSVRTKIVNNNGSSSALK